MSPPRGVMNRRNSGWLLAILVVLVWATSSIYPTISHRRYYLIWQPPAKPDWFMMDSGETYHSREACLAERERSIINSYDRKLQVASKDLNRKILSLSRYLGLQPLPPPITDLILHGLDQTRRSLDDLAIERRVNLSECVEVGDPRAVSAIAAKRAEIDARQAQQASEVVAYTPGKPIVVSATLNNRLLARLILDTGADRSVIGPRSLIAAGVDLTRPVARGKIRGVAGEIEVSYFIMDSIEIGKARVSALKIAAYDIGESVSDGLLGRDFLDSFNVSIDSAAGIISLTPR